MAASKTGDPVALAETVVREARRLVGAGGATLRWYEPSGRLHLLAADGITDPGEDTLDAAGETAMAEAIRLRRPVLVNQYHRSRRATPWGLAHAVQSMVAVPLLVESRPVGGLAILSFVPRRFLAEDADALKLLAAIAAPSLEAARLGAEVQRQQRVSERVYSELIRFQEQLIGPDLAVAETMELVVEAACRLTGADGAAVQTVEEGVFHFHAGRGSGEPVAGQRLNLSPSLFGLAMASGRTEYAADAVNDERCDRQIAAKWGIASLAVTPLRHQGRPIGALGIFGDRPGAFDEEQLRALEILGGLAGAAISRSQSHLALRESQERYGAVVAAALDPIVLFDQAGLIAEFNPAAERAFGRPRAAAVGQPLSLLVGEAEQAALSRWLREGARQGSPAYAGLRFETVARRADESEFPIEVSIALMPESTGLVAAFLRDLTTERESEEKSRMMAVMGHEVRTPLNSVLGFAELLRTTAGDSLSPSQVRYVNNIEAAGRHLLTLVNDSLDLAKLNSGTLRIEPADLPLLAVLEQAAEQVRPLAEARGLTLIVSAPRALTVRADRRRLLQVLWNLLGNAIRHTDPPGTVELWAEARSRGVAIHVADTGEGIAEADRERIFQEWVRAGQRGEGSGLGLPISRRLLQLMEGAIEVQSRVGEGSTFTAFLPGGRA